MPVTAYRSALTEGDIEPIVDVTRTTGFFSPDEVDIARELVTLNVRQGETASGYYYLVLDVNSRIDAYACYGPIPGTEASFDLYWIVVAPQLQGKGLGGELIDEVARRVGAKGGRRLYADTSSREHYALTRAFYRRSQFEQAALLDDFYAEGDGKVIFVRKLGAHLSGAGRTRSPSVR